MPIMEAIDQGAVHPFRHVALVEPLRPLLVGLSYLGHPLVLAGVVLLAGLYFLRRKEPGTALRLLFTYLIALGIALAGVLLVPRPWPNVPWSPLPPLTTHSFPSVQALGATAVFGSLGVLLAYRLRRRWPLFVGPLLALIVGADQLCVGHNYLTDVFAGWILGGVLAFVCVQADAAPARAV